MNENINLVEILKDAPKDMKLYSPICGECKFVGIGNYPSSIKCEALEDNYLWKFRSDGTFAIYKDAECLLFPSKNNRDWSTFKAPWKRKHFEPFQKVLISSLVDTFPCKEIWVPVLYGYYDEETKAHILTNGSSRDDNGIIPYEGNEDKLGKQVEK